MGDLDFGAFSGIAGSIGAAISAFGSLAFGGILLIAIVIGYLLSRAHAKAYIPFSVDGVLVMFARIVAIVMVIISAFAITEILTSISAGLFGDSYTYGEGHSADESLVLTRSIVNLAIALVVYILFLIWSRALASSQSANFVRRAFTVALTLVFAIASLGATFNLADSIITRTAARGPFDDSVAVGAPLASLVVAISFFLISFYFLLREQSMGNRPAAVADSGDEPESGE